MTKISIRWANGPGYVRNSSENNFNPRTPSLYCPAWHWYCPAWDIQMRVHGFVMFSHSKWNNLPSFKTPQKRGSFWYKLHLLSISTSRKKKHVFSVFSNLLGMSRCFCKFCFFDWKKRLSTSCIFCCQCSFLEGKLHYFFRLFYVFSCSLCGSWL